MIRTWPGVGAAAVSLLLLGAACSGEDEQPDLSVPSDVAPRSDDADSDDATDATDGATDDDATDDATDPLIGETFHVAQAVDDALVVRASAQEGADELVTLSAADEVSGKIICLVSQQVGMWVEVHLPSGPTHRTGWVAREDVALSRHRFRIEVSRSTHTLTLYTGEVVALTAPIALGPDAPPAGEHLFIKDLVKSPNPASPYGAYAYGLSGSDNELGDFTSGSGVVAVHGTGDPSSLGGEVPYGAIAVGDDIVTRFVDTIGIPLGTPVDVVE
jgi:lipoprotein-anchoring transpeptidase ErfK/SrfK